MGQLRSGVSLQLEAMADEIIFSHVRDLPPAEKMDILTTWKMESRLEKEVFNVLGVADASVRQGIFGRAYNRYQPHLNSTKSGGNRTKSETPSDEYAESYDYLSPEMSQIFGIEVPTS